MFLTCSGDISKKVSYSLNRMQDHPSLALHPLVGEALRHVYPIIVWVQTDQSLHSNRIRLLLHSRSYARHEPIRLY